jgi:hypothetical protein
VDFPYISDADVQWTFEGKSYDLDLTDEDVREHFSQCAKKIAESSVTDTRGLIRELSHFLDSVFDVGVGVSVLGDKPSLRKALNCKNSIIAYAKGLTETIKTSTAYGKEFKLS